MSEMINHGFRVFNDDNYDCNDEFISSSDNIKQDEIIEHHNKLLTNETKNDSLGVSRHKKNSSASQNRLQVGVRNRKHSRDSDGNSKNSTEERKSENARIVLRKTLEVDDPIEAANSSIRTTLQTNNNNRRLRPSGAKGGGFFRGVQQNNGSEHHERRHSPIDETSATVLEFNPAAFSRSLLFHEISR